MFNGAGVLKSWPMDRSATFTIEVSITLMNIAATSTTLTGDLLVHLTSAHAPPVYPMLTPKRQV